MSSESVMRLRETKYVSSQLEQIHLDGTFCGYASVFNEVDLGNDVVVPGAFSASLARRGASNIRMLFQHNPDEPIGVWKEIRETRHDLKVRGHLTTAVERGREVHELMRVGAVDGLSIGFKTVRSKQDPKTGTRRILVADLWEISVVTFPMQESARIDAVKNSAFSASRENLKPTIREFERWLVRDAGLSRSDARLVVTKGYRQAIGQRDATKETDPLANHIRNAARAIETHTIRN